MRKRIAIGVAICITILASLIFHQSVQAQTSLNVRYESGLFWAQQNDDVTGIVENLDTVAHNFRVIVTGTTSGAGLTVVLDSGVISIPAGTGSHADYVLPSGTATNNYNVEITTDSNSVIPTVEAVPSGAPPRLWEMGHQLMKFKQDF